MAPAEEAAGAASVEVAAGADPANNQDPEADGGLNDGLAPTDPVAPPHRHVMIPSAFPTCVRPAATDNSLQIIHLKEIAQRSMLSLSSHLRHLVS